MPKNVMKLLKPSPTRGKNAFDMSHRVVNSINFGELMPFLCLETVPDSKFNIKAADLIRALPLVTSPFMRAKQHIDIWFVPYNSLWSRFNEFMVDKDEPLGSSLKGRQYVPSVDLGTLVNKIRNVSSDVTDVVGQSYVTGALRLLDALGYPVNQAFFDAKGDVNVTDFEKKRVNLWRLLAYNYIWYKEYRQQYYDRGDRLMTGSDLPVGILPTPMLYNADWMQCTSRTEADLFSATGTFENLPVAMCQMRYRCWKKDLFTGLMPSSQFGMVSEVANSSPIFADFEGSLAHLSGSTDSDRGKWIKDGDTTYNSHVASPNVAYVQVDGDGQSIFENYTSDSGGGIYSHTHPITADLTIDDASATITAGTNLFDVLALRRAEAVQIWRENALRAGNQVEDNFVAHYGARPKSHMNSHPVHIGSLDAPLNIGDIDAHATTGSGANQQLADVAGKGISSLNSREFKFQTSDFGVIIGLVSILPETEYMSCGIDRMNQLLEREDYFIPEYAKLGLQPVDSSTFVWGLTDSFDFGYAPRDFGYKQKVDQVHLDFFNMYLEDTVAKPDLGDYTMLGQFRNWTSPKYDIVSYMTQVDGAPTLSLSFLYVNPALFDINFGVSVDMSRQFMVDMYFDCDMIAPMPVSGMPSY